MTAVPNVATSSNKTVKLQDINENSESDSIAKATNKVGQSKG